VFGPLGTLQNVSVISSMQITPVVGLRLPDCCWPVVGVPVVTPSALAVLLVASWLFVVAFVAEVCAWTLGGGNSSDTKASAAIEASFFMGATRFRRSGRRFLPAATLEHVSSTFLVIVSFDLDSRSTRRPFFKKTLRKEFHTVALRAFFKTV